MDDFLHELLENTKKMFPGATSVRIVVTNEDVKINKKTIREGGK